ncbi:MAG: hypothetical protein V4751_04040 [Pseudomonadota bacterium]
MKFNNPLTAFALFLSLFAGHSAMAQTAPVAHCDTLYAGQTNDAGQVCVTIDEDTVQIDYLLNSGWKLSEVHAWVGEDRALMPQNRKGNPQVGRFPYSDSGLGALSSYSFVIPVSELPVDADTFCGAEVFVAAHAVVSRTSSGGKGKSGGTESAWAGSNQIVSGGSWARYYSFTNDFCEDPDPEYPVVVLPQGCFNVFGMGTSSDVMPVSVTGFTPVGVTDTTSAWINSYGSNPGYFEGSLFTGNGTRVGAFFAGVDSGEFAVELALDVNHTPSLTLNSGNIYFNTAGSYQTQSPLDYTLGLSGNGTGYLFSSVPVSFTPENMDTVVHAVVCTESAD